jgi:HSP20 family protein
MQNVTQWDPFCEQPCGDLLADMFGDWVSRLVRQRSPGHGAPLAISVDVTQNEESYTVRADMPGVTREDIRVSIDRNVVTIGAQVKRDGPAGMGETVLREERYVGRRQRSFTLPTEVDLGKARAIYADGVLRLVLPKRAGAEEQTLAIL